MNPLPLDIRYAYMQLGLPQSSSAEQIQETIVNARAYRFSTRERLTHAQRFAGFFAARSRLGELSENFDAIRKAYHREVMALHPDRNHNDPTAIEQLKVINAAYELIEAVHKEAKTYFKYSYEERSRIENEARAATEREARSAGKQPSSNTVHMSYAEAGAEETKHPAAPNAPPRPVMGAKYMAASIPRFIRSARLFYLDRDNIIGSYVVSPEGGQNLVYDVIMLPQIEFNRARLRLTMEGYGVQELTMSKLTPPYIPRDIKEIFVPLNEENPEEFARNYFMKQYKLL